MYDGSGKYELFGIVFHIGSNGMKMERLQEEVDRTQPFIEESEYSEDDTAGLRRREHLHSDVRRISAKPQEDPQRQHAPPISLDDAK